jgi:hypothetical protein
MTSLRQYRQFSVWAMIFMMVALVLSLGALWNSLLTSTVRHEGWIIVFLMTVFISGILLFYVAFKTTDAEHFDSEIKNAYECGKTEILKELEKRNQEEKSDLKFEQEDIDKTTARIISGIKKAGDSKTSHKILASLARNMGFVQGILYVKDAVEELFHAEGEFALTGQKPAPFRKGEGFAGQAAESKSTIILYDVPEQYFNVASGLGSSKPRFLLLVPVLFENECCGVIELAAFTKPDETTGKILQKVSAELGIILHTSFAA